jgi:hypothetical protein
MLVRVFGWLAIVVPALVAQMLQFTYERTPTVQRERFRFLALLPRPAHTIASNQALIKLKKDHNQSKQNTT